MVNVSNHSSSFSKMKELSAPHIPVFRANIPLSSILHGIAERVNYVWKRLCEGVKFTAAYFGSKDYSFFTPTARLYKWVFSCAKPASSESGYERYPRRELNQDELRHCAVFCSITAFVNNDNDTFISPFGIKAESLETKFLHHPESRKQLEELGFQFHGNILYNSNTGVKMTLFLDEKGHHYLGYGDASALERYGKDRNICELEDMQKKIRAKGASQLMAGDLESVESAKKATALLVSALDFNPQTLTLVGQCYGGLLSTYAGISLGYKSIGINSVSFGAHAQIHLGDKLNKAKESAVHFFTDKDLTQNYPAISFFDKCLSMLGIRTPGCFGRKFTIPNVYSGLLERHNYTLANCFAGLGLDKRTKPETLSDKDRQLFKSNFEKLIHIQ